MNLLNFLSNNIFGQLGDQVGSIWLGNIFFSKKFELINYYSFEYFRINPENFGNLLFSHLYNFIYLIFSYFIGGVLAYNVLSFIFVLLNSLSLYLLLKDLKIDKNISIIFSALLSLIPYFYSHLEHHTLLVLFPSIFLMRILFKEKFISFNLKIILISSFLFVLQGLFSLYLVYFLGIYITFYFLISFFIYKNRKILLNFLLIILISLITFILFNFQILFNLFFPSTSEAIYNFPSYDFSNSISTFPYERSRPLNDFIYFSSRPWYLILYPTSHSFLGDFTKRVISYFSEERDIWIFKNHFPAEHNASFIGLTILLILIIGIFKKIIFKNPLTKILFFINLALIILMMPPYIPIGSFGIYTPSYIMYLLFPMFRSTARLAIFIQINFFIISAIIVNNLASGFSYGKRNILLASLTVLLVFDFIFNYKFVEITRFDETNNFLKVNNLDKKMVAAYPLSFRNELLLNMVYHESPIFNPAGLVKKELEFDSNEFTKSLDTCQTLNYFTKFNGKFIIIKNFNEFNFANLNRLNTVFESKEESIIIKSLENLSQVCIIE